MIKSNLPLIMAQNGIRTITELSERTNLSRNTLTSLYYTNGKGVQFNTLEILCSYFNCGIGDILEYREEKEAS